MQQYNAGLVYSVMIGGGYMLPLQLLVVSSFLYGRGGGQFGKYIAFGKHTLDNKAVLQFYNSTIF